MTQAVLDAVSLLCELAEAGSDEFCAAELRERSTDAVSLLMSAGALSPGALSLSVTCRACDGDHSASVEFDPRTHNYHHFCPEAGFVLDDEADLATLHYDPEWLVDWMIAEMPVIPPIRRRVLIKGRVWHLGDIQCGATLVTALLTRMISTQANLDTLVSELEALPPADLGLIATSSARVARRVALPHGYRFLDLREFVRPGKGQLTLDRAKLGASVKYFLKSDTRNKRTGPGRPSDKARVLAIFEERRSRGIPYRTALGEATAILSEFSERYPELDTPHPSTIRKHLPRTSS